MSGGEWEGHERGRGMRQRRDEIAEGSVMQGC